MKKILLILLLLIVPILCSCSEKNAEKENVEFKKNAEILSKLYEEVDEKILCYKLNYRFNSSTIGIEMQGIYEMNIKLKYTNAFISSEIIEFSFVDKRYEVFDNAIYEQKRCEINYKEGIYEYIVYYYGGLGYDNDKNIVTELFKKEVSYFQDDRKIYYNIFSNFYYIDREFEIEANENNTLLSLHEKVNPRNPFYFKVLFNKENEMESANVVRYHFMFNTGREFSAVKCDDFNINIEPTDFSKDENSLIDMINSNFDLMRSKFNLYMVKNAIVFEKEDMRNVLEVVNAKKN